MNKTDPLHLEGEEWFNHFSGLIALMFPGMYMIVNKILSGEQPTQKEMEAAVVLDTVIQVLLRLPEIDKRRLLEGLRGAN